MTKFPSQRKLMYEGAAISNGNFAQTHIISLPKDLSIVNRRGYASTTRKGVPLVFRVAATVYPAGLDGSGYVTNVSSDVKTTVKYLGCQNNWVSKNAAVKWHAAREALWKAAGISKKDIGAWAKEVRYCYAAYNETLAAPVDGVGAAFAGGTWDLTPFVTEDDAEFMLALTGDGVDEDASFNATQLNFMFSYLSSRATVPADSNLESSDVPATNSKLQQILNWNSGVTRAEMSYIQEDVDNVQDNPPYHAFGSGSTTHDVTEEVELGRVMLYPQGSGGSLPMTTIIDIPFGIMRVLASHQDPGNNSGVVDDLALGLEVLDIFEMQG